MSVLVLPSAHAARSTSACLASEFISALYEPSATEVRIEKELTEMNGAVFAAGTDQARQIQLITKMERDLKSVPEAEYPAKNQVISSLRGLEHGLAEGGLEGYLQHPYEPGEVVPLFRRYVPQVNDKIEIMLTQGRQRNLEAGELEIIKRNVFEKGRANRLTRESISRLSVNHPVAFVVNADGQLVTGENHTLVGFMLDQRSAGEILIQTRVDPKTGEPVLEKVLVSLKSGRYRLGESLFGFRAAIRAFLDLGLRSRAGIRPEGFRGRRPDEAKNDFGREAAVPIQGQVFRSHHLTGLFDTIGRHS